MGALQEVWRRQQNPPGTRAGRLHPFLRLLCWSQVLQTRSSIRHTKITVQRRRELSRLLWKEAEAGQCSQVHPQRKERLPPGFGGGFGNEVTVALENANSLDAERPPKLRALPPRS